MEEKGHVSRALFCKELSVGEGIIRTLLKHLKMQGLIEFTKNGTTMTEKGITILSGLLSCISGEMYIPRSSIALGKFNYVVLLKQFGFAVKSGIEQKDAAIKTGATEATSLLFKHNRFVIPGTNYDSLSKEPYTAELLIDRLKSEDVDVIIIGSALIGRIR